MDAATAEEQASHVVILIQECVSILRSVKEFAPGQHSSIALDNVELSTKFEKLISKIRQCSQVDNSMETGDSPHERYIVVKSVLWPLLTGLGRCYAALDQIPPRPQTGKQKKPPPPPGMLSIQNYTDIAVFIEFLVACSILPLVQQNVLPSAQDRARYSLPKSLAGRIPRASLLWGCAVQNTMSERNLPETILELRSTAAIIGNVVTLDRFRPMLLPRHVVDLCAAMLQADALEHQWKIQSKTKDILVPAEYKRIKELLLPSTKADAKLLVDPFTQARAYQTLLLRGTSSPRWLRQQVSKLLNRLACQDIGAIVHAFVQSAGENMTSASQRLARALTADVKDNKDYFAALCRQLVTLLDVPATHQMGNSLNPNQQAGVLTVLAVLDQVPFENTMKYLFPLLARDLVPFTEVDSSGTSDNATPSIHRVIRRIGILLSSLPPSYNGLTIGRLLLSRVAVDATNKPMDGAIVTIVSQLLRIAAMESVVVLNIKEDAIFTLQCTVQTLIQSSFGPEGGGVDVATLALVYCIAPTALDIQGYRYKIPTREDIEKDTVTSVTFDKDPDKTAHDISAVAQIMEQLIAVVVEKILLPLTKMAGAEDATISAQVESASRLPSTMFHLLLRCYFYTIATTRSRSVPPKISKDREELPSVFRGISIYIQLTVMILLPFLCEKCSPESLLLADDGGIGILSMIKLILDCASTICGRTVEDDVNDVTLCPPVSDDDERPFSLADNVLIDFLALKDDRCIVEDGDYDNDYDLSRDESWISISAVVLTLLVTMLELGTQKRSDKEESLLASMIPTLGTLARFRERYSIEGLENSLFQPELAEMAAHAMVLIAARSQKSEVDKTDEASAHPRGHSLMESIHEAEKDLESEQPPIRARGVALLTKISHRYLNEKEEQLHASPLITIVDDNTKGKEDSNASSDVLSEILRVSVVALADIESYVYLAAIQSIVKAADVSPREVIPLIGNGVALGTISFDRSGKEGEGVQVQLTSEQRIKLSEALLFTIRRREKAIYEFVPLLMNLVLHGLPERTTDHRPSGLDARIQEETHRYFVEGTDQHHDEEERRSREDLDLRVRTGGPVFQSEENDVLRAGCVAVLAELISSALPAVVARHCRTLIHFAATSLTLETSRPVRRATAILCYELYCAILREQDEESYGSVDLPSSLAVETVSSGEEELLLALKRCVNASDVKTRLYDPAMTERCKEALDARMAIERSGILPAAKLYLITMEQGSSSRAADVVRARLNEGRANGSKDVVRAMKGLKVGADSLKFVP